MTDDEKREMLLFILQREQMDNLFLKRLISHLVTVVPEFEPQALLDTLYLDLQNLPSPPQDHPEPAKSSEGLRISFWKRKIELAEQGISAGEEMLRILGEREGRKPGS